MVTQKDGGQEGTSMSPGNSKVSHESCVAVREVLNRVGDKWSILVVTLLNEGPRRFSDLRGRSRASRSAC